MYIATKALIPLCMTIGTIGNCQICDYHASVIKEQSSLGRLQSAVVVQIHSELLGVPSFRNQILAAQGGALYFSTDPRIKLVFVNEGLSGPNDLVQEIELVSNDDGISKCIARITNGSKKPTSVTYEVSAQGITVLNRPGGVKVTPSECLLKLPYKEGEAWVETHTTTKGAKWTVKKTTSSKEEIRVPAGLIEAICVKSEASNGEKTIREECWYAKGLGCIRHKIENVIVEELKLISKGMP
jgi:hypothetical protein